MPGELNLDYSLLTPEFCLAGLAAIVLGLDLFAPRFRKEWLPYITAAGLIGVLGMSFGWVNKESQFAGLLYVDNYTTFFRVFFTATTAAVALASAHFVQGRLRHPGEYYALLVLSTIGAIYMAAARELERGRHEVHAARRLLVGAVPVRAEPDLRLGRLDVLRRHRRGVRERHG